MHTSAHSKLSKLACGKTLQASQSVMYVAVVQARSLSALSLFDFWIVIW